jgi:hypothetical protein
MWTEYARQTRWGHDPEAVDEEQVPEGTVYVKEVVWVPCSECDLQVHVTYTQLLTSGVHCPECGSPLPPPSSPSTPTPAVIRERAAKVLQEEDEFRQRASMEENPCSD